MSPLANSLSSRRTFSRTARNARVMTTKENRMTTSTLCRDSSPQAFRAPRYFVSLLVVGCILWIGCTPGSRHPSGPVGVGTACDVPLRTVEEPASEGQVIVLMINDNTYPVVANYSIEERDPGGAVVKTCQGTATLTANRKTRVCVYFKPNHVIVGPLSCGRA